MSAAFACSLPMRSKLTAILIALLLIGPLGLVSCAALNPSPLPTPLPPDYLPTAAALTLAASGLQLPVATTAVVTITDATFTATTLAAASPTTVTTQQPTAESSPTAPPPSPEPPTEAATDIPSIILTDLPTLSPATPTFSATPLFELTPNPFLLATATETPLPAIPEARIQIFQLGELSLVTSPIKISARLSSQVGKVVRVELYGEDGRLLARHVRTYSRIPWTTAVLGLDLEFEISAAAEAGRLVISVEDSYGRLIDVNSVNLILLSQGITELKPPSALQQAIVIQDPAPKTLVQGGKLYVSGLAKPFYDQPLRVVLLTQDGRTVGQRLAGVTYTTPGFHGKFFAEVSYTVSELTPVLVVVYEEGGVVSPYTHLASVEIFVSP